MNPRAIVAIILALCVMLFIMGAMGLRLFNGDITASVEVTQAWEVTLAAIIGALSVYIAGTGKDDK